MAVGKNHMKKEPREIRGKNRFFKKNTANKSGRGNIWRHKQFEGEESES